MGLFSKGGLFSKIVGSIPVVGGIASGIVDAVSGSQKNAIAAGDSAETIRSNKAREAYDKLQLAESGRVADQTNRLGQFNAQENARQFGVDNAAKQEATNFGRVQQNRFAKVRAPMVTGLLQGRSLRQPPPVTPAAMPNKFAPLTGIGQ